MEPDYEFREVEERLAREWVDTERWAAPRLPSSDKRYVVTMFPYPSGDMHMGHVEVFSIHDALARFSRMRGFSVLSPLGFDAFGLPAENAAIKRGINPKEWTYANIAQLKSSAQRLGCSFDWSRSFATCDPSFYKWNQWFFLRFFERGLAYRERAPVNWCPNDKTVLANEQVIAGRCERCDAVVTKRWLTQWFFRTTDYADRLIDDLAINVGWSERLKMLQRNWIGRSEGAEVRFDIEGESEPVTVFTTRPDTLWGATFFVLAPEHPLCDRLARGTEYEGRLASFRAKVESLTEIDRTSTERAKKGIWLGKHATNPVTGEAIPIWAADYVLMDYGTGAVMAVPAHDQRDFEFARSYDLPVRVAIQPASGALDPSTMDAAYLGEGVMVGSGTFDGTPSDRSVAAVTQWLEQEGRGRHAVNYRLRDWLISRQRYWGTPIPIVHCAACGEVPVPEEELPVTLPDDVDFAPTGEQSPLAGAHEWVNVRCPKCGADAHRDTDTMDTFVDSSWYFHRYLDAHNDEEPFAREVDDAWMAIDQYTGGIEHAVLHLIYARFWQKILVDMGMARDPEPFPALLNQGQVTMGAKRMSKSRGNLVDPTKAFERYGADALRLYILFSGPPDADFDWPEEGVDSIGRVTYPWLQRVWRLVVEAGDAPVTQGATSAGPLIERMHRTIKVVTADYEAFSFNTAIARLMELVNDAYRYKAEPDADAAVLRRVVESVLLLLCPMAPFVTDEAWRRLGHEGSVHDEPWPVFDALLAAEQEVVMIVQVNGRVRDRITVPADVSEDIMVERAFGSDKVREHLGGREPAKVIARPPKLVSLVVATD